MTEPSVPEAAPQVATQQFPPPAPPVDLVAPPRRSRLPLILTIVVVSAVAIAAAAWFGTQAVLQAITFAGGSQTSGQMHTYTSPTLGYTIEFPTEPTEQTLSNVVGDITIEQVMVTWESGARYFAVASLALPLEAQGQDVDSFLKNSVDGMLAEVPEARLVESHPVSLDGAPGTGGSFEVAGSGVMFFVISIRNEVQYILLASGPDNNPMKDFATSFAFGD